MLLKIRLELNQNFLMNWKILQPKPSSNFSIFLGHGKATAAMTRKPSKKE